MTLYGFISENSDLLKKECKRPPERYSLRQLQLGKLLGILLSDLSNIGFACLVSCFLL